MKHLLISTVLFGIAACQPAMATMPNAPRGAIATGCDMDEYTPVFGRNGNILYWLNPTCPTTKSNPPGRSKDDWPEVPLPQHPGPGDGNDDDHDDEDNPGNGGDNPGNGGEDDEGGGDKPKDNNGHGNGDEGDCSGSGCNDPDNPGNKPDHPKDEGKDKPKKNK